MELERLMVRLVADSSVYNSVLNRAEARFLRMADRLSFFGNRGAAALITPFLALGAIAVTNFAIFDDRMNRAISIMDNVNESSRKMMELRAFEVSSSGITSINDLASAYLHLGQAGMSPVQSMEALSVVERFSVASATNMERATENLLGTLNALGMATTDAGQQMLNLTRIGNVFTDAARATLGSVDELANAMSNKAAAQLRILNKDLEEGTAILGIYASMNIRGRRAGDMLSQMFRGVQAAQQRFSASWDQMGIRLYDANGRMVTTVALIRQLEDRLRGLTDQQKISALMSLGLPMRSLHSLFPLIGRSEDLAAMERRLRGVGNTMEEIYQQRITSFVSQVKILWNVIQIAAVGIGQVFAPYLMMLNSIVRQAMGVWNGLNDKLKEGIVLFLGLLTIVHPLFRILTVGIFYVIGSWRMLIAALSSTVILMNLGLVAAWVGDQLENLDLSLEGLANFLEIIGGVFSMVGTALLGAFSAIWDVLVSMGSSIVSILIEVFTSVMDVVRSSFLGPFLLGLWQLISGVGLVFFSFLKIVTYVMREVIAVVWTVIGFILSVLGTLVAGAIWAGSAIISAISGAVAFFISGLASGWGKIRSLVGPFLEDIVGLIQGVFSAIGGLFNIIAGAFGFVAKLFQVIQTELAKLASNILDVWGLLRSGALLGVFDFFTSMFSDIGGFFESFLASVGEFFGGIWTAVGGVASAVSDMVGSFFASLTLMDYLSGAAIALAVVLGSVLVRAILQLVGSLIMLAYQGVATVIGWIYGLIVSLLTFAFITVPMVIVNLVMLIANFLIFGTVAVAKAIIAVTMFIVKIVVLIVKMIALAVAFTFNAVVGIVQFVMALGLGMAGIAGTIIQLALLSVALLTVAVVVIPIVIGAFVLLFGAIVSLIGMIVATVVALVMALVSIVTTIASAIGKAFSQAFGEVTFDDISSKVQGFIANFQENMQILFTWIKNNWGAIWENARTVISRFWGGLVSGFQQVLELMQRSWRLWSENLGPIWSSDVTIAAEQWGVSNQEAYDRLQAQIAARQREAIPTAVSSAMAGYTPIDITAPVFNFDMPGEDLENMWAEWERRHGSAPWREDSAAGLPNFNMPNMSEQSGAGNTFRQIVLSQFQLEGPGGLARAGAPTRAPVDTGLESRLDEIRELLGGERSELRR